MCAVEGALPNAAPETPTDPSLFAKRTFEIFEKWTCTSLTVSTN